MTEFRPPLRPFAITRRALLGTAAALLAAPMLPRASFAADAPRHGGTLVMAVWPDPVQLIGAFSTSDQMTIVSPKTTEGLLSYGYDFQPQPQLATAWEVAPDGLTIRFTLRQGVKWHDGQDFTSADVAYTILEILKKYHPRGRVAYANVTSAETPDPSTVILHLAKPSPMIMNALAGYESPMLPKHVYEAGGDPLRNPANNAPIGTGPFKFVEWQRGDHITFERNPAYWDAGKPYLDRIIIRIINDASARSAAIEAGEVQLAGPNPVPYSEIARFRDNPKVAVETRGEELLTHGQGLQINLRQPDPGQGRGPPRDLPIDQPGSAGAGGLVRRGPPGDQSDPVPGGRPARAGPAGLSLRYQGGRSAARWRRIQAGRRPDAFQAEAGLDPAGRGEPAHGGVPEAVVAPCRHRCGDPLV